MAASEGAEGRKRGRGSVDGGIYIWSGTFRSMTNKFAGRWIVNRECDVARGICPVAVDEALFDKEGRVVELV